MNSDEKSIPKHPSGINQTIVTKVFTRRGRLHAFPTLDPTKTVLAVIDLDTGTVTRVGNEIREFVPTINDLAKTLRKHGGTVAWVTTPIRQATNNFRAIYGQKLTETYEAEGAPRRQGSNYMV
jgi:hypothetical protein